MQRGVAEEGNDEDNIKGADKEEENDEEITSKHNQDVYKELTDVFNSQYDPHDVSTNTSQLQIVPFEPIFVCALLLTLFTLTYSWNCLCF